MTSTIFEHLVSARIPQTFESFVTIDHKLSRSSDSFKRVCERKSKGAYVNDTRRRFTEGRVSGHKGDYRGIGKP